MESQTVEPRSDLRESEELVALHVAGLRAVLIEALVDRLELHREDALHAVDHMIRSEQSGKHTHGLIRAVYTSESGKFGPYGGVRAPTPQLAPGGRLEVDGAGAFGYAVMHRLIHSGCDVAVQSGMCLATGKAVYPSGALGDWARLAAARGVGLFLAASSPSRVAAPGGSRPVVGTNAVCIGLPADPIPFVADCATSEITHGQLLLARQGDLPLPEGSAVGPDGEPTRSAALVDPTKGLGALLPFGASHKSFALAMGIELLASIAGCLPGQTQVGQHGVFCVFIGPQHLDAGTLPRSEWLNELDDQGTRIPGFCSARRALMQERRGLVEVPRETYTALARGFGAEQLANLESRR